MTASTIQDRRAEVAIEYFRRVDRADPTLGELFTEDASMYFPKLGIAKGKEEIAHFAQGFAAEIIEIKHDIDNFNIMPSGNFIIVEGQESGKTRSGGAFPDGLYSQGRFCNVFEFEGELISRVHIYTDPDFNSTDTLRREWANGVHVALANPY
jgi:ketosteroid isomerase-like protein